MNPGEYILQDEAITINANKKAKKVKIKNSGDRPIQVGSHYHLYEVNHALQLKREEVYGKRLNIPAGAAVRFEPGDEKEVEVIDFSGKRQVYGFHNEVDGSLD